MTPRKNETHEQYLARRRDYDRAAYKTNFAINQPELIAQIKGLEAGCQELEDEIGELEAEIQRCDKYLEELGLLVRFMKVNVRRRYW